MKGTIMPANGIVSKTAIFTDEELEYIERYLSDQNDEIYSKIIKKIAKQLVLNEGKNN